MKKIAMLALLLGLLAGCGAAKVKSALPEEMPADFEIRYENWVDADAINIYDTGEKLLQKDLVDSDGPRTAQAALTVSDETLQAIYAKVRACALDQLGDEKLTSENLTIDGTQVGVSPLREYEITFYSEWHNLYCHRRFHGAELYQTKRPRGAVLGIYAVYGRAVPQQPGIPVSARSGGRIRLAEYKKRTQIASFFHASAASSALQPA